MTVLDALLVALFVASLTFVLWYGTTRRWWRTLEGWALIVSATGWTLIGGGFTYDDWVGEVPYEAWTVIAGFALLAALIKLAMLMLGHHRKP